MGDPIPRTHLSLAEYARIMGIPPLHFWGAITSTVFPRWGSCDDVWPHYSWQTAEDLVSRHELAQYIQDAERDIKQVIGFSIAPEWEVEELHSIWPIHRARFDLQTVETDWGHIIAPGQRALEEVELAATVVYSDADGDGWDELATITVATALTDQREIKVYHAGHDGEAEWEVRPVRSIAIAGGVATITLDSWLLIDPDLYEQFPANKQDVPAILLDDTTPLVETVDVYREYNDSTTQATLYWDRLTYGGVPPYCANCSGSGCEQCTLEAQTACYTIADARFGAVVPRPATYDAENQVWLPSSPCVGRAYDSVKLWYLAGNRDKRYISRRTLDPLDPYLAQAVVWLATARINKPLCGCGAAQERARAYQRDLTRSDRESGFYVRYKDMDIFSNPFGTRDGEVRAWQRVATMLSNPSVVSGGML